MLGAEFNLNILLAAILTLGAVGILRKIFGFPEALSIIIAILILAVSISVIFFKIVIKPLRELARTFNSLTTEGIEASILKVDIKSENEFGELARGFNRVITVFQGIISQIEEAAEGLNSVSKNLSNYSQEMNSSIQQVSSVIQGVVRGVTTQADRTKLANESLRDISEAINQTSLNISTVNTISSEQVLKNTHFSQEFTQEMADRIDKISLLIKNSAGKVSSLGGSFQQISVITETITKVADQTNLLALNAAIEAARAGEAGRGFSVVAEEIRKLAENTANSTKSIKDLIKRMQLEIAEVVSSTEAGNKEMGEGNKSVSRVKAALDEVIRLIQQMVFMIRDIYEISQEQVASIKGVSRDVEEVTLISQQNASAAEEVSSSAQEQTASMEELASVAQELSQGAIGLKALVARFKVGEEAR